MTKCTLPLQDPTARGVGGGVWFCSLVSRVCSFRVLLEIIKMNVRQRKSSAREGTVRLEETAGSTSLGAVRTTQLIILMAGRRSPRRLYVPSPGVSHRSSLISRSVRPFPFTETHGFARRSYSSRPHDADTL